MGILYVSPTGSGDVSGSSVENAAQLSSLNTLVAKAGAGGEVRLIADQGVYHLNSDLQLMVGDVTVRGVDSAGAPLQAVISSPNTASIFILRPGADNMSFKDLRLEDTTGGYGAVRIGGDIHGLTLDNVDGSNLATFLAVGASPGSTASVDGLTVRNADVVGYSSAAIKISGDSKNILLEHITLDGQNKDPSQYMMGVHLYGTTHDVVIRGVVASNNLYTGADYWNGDGFVAEGEVYNVLLQDVAARNNGDAGFDLKSGGTRLENAVSEGNGRNFRFWGDGVTAVNIKGISPHVQGGSSGQNQVWIADNAHATISGGEFTDRDPATVVFAVQDGGGLILVDTTVSKAAAADLQWTGTGATISDTTTDPSAAAAAPPPEQVAAPAPAPPLEAAPSGVKPAATSPTGSEPSPETTPHPVSAPDASPTEPDAAAAPGSPDPADPVAEASGLPLVQGGSDADTLQGKAGADEIRGEAGDDLLNGGRGDDLLVGGSGHDTLSGGVGDDTLVGGAGHDVLAGGRGHDSLGGGGGDDVLFGANGSDTLSGGGGMDEFHFGRQSGGDHIIDFSAADGDRIVVDGAIQHVFQSGEDTIIDLGSGRQVTLDHVRLDSLHEGWIVGQ